jgi:hypothetical protein
MEKETLKQLFLKHRGKPQDVFIHESDAEKIIREITSENSNLIEIGTYEPIDSKGNYINNPLKHPTGFYWKKDNIILTIYIEENGYHSGFTLNVSITNLNKRSTSFIGEGFGNSGTKFIKESYVLNECGEIFEIDNAKNLTNIILHNFKNL